LKQAFFHSLVIHFPKPTPFSSMNEYNKEFARSNVLQWIDLINISTTKINIGQKNSSPDFLHYVSLIPYRK